MKFFNPYEDIRHSKNKLPHWEQPGACYFVTFRLADSIPTGVLSSWREEFDAWLAHHPEPHTPEQKQERHDRLSERIQEHLDAGEGSCLLREPAAREIVKSALLHFDGERYALHAFVIMPNHVHCLFTGHPEAKISAILHSWRSYTANEINRLLRREGKSLWQRDYFDRIIRDQSHFANTVRYIRKNPTKARLQTTEFAHYEDPIAAAVPHSAIG